MKISILTPTHKPEHLAVPFRSLSHQRGISPHDFEWVIGRNNTEEVIQQMDAPFNIRIVDMVGESTDIGYIKHWLFHQGEGEYLLELDHDDELHPDSLAILLETIEEQGRPDFVFSDSVHIHDATGETQVYSGRYGWKPPYPVSWFDTQYFTNPAFPVSAASLHDIFYSPDHFRAWRKDFYVRIGGHNPMLPVADDHELLQRTYIAGGSMVHIPLCLYFYHLHENGENTYLERNALIQKLQAANGDNNRDALIQEWCTRKNLVQVELGGSESLDRTGVIGIALKGADLNRNIMEDGLPFADNSVGLIKAQDFLEHIPHCRNSACEHKPIECVVALMNEIWRVLAPNGWFISRTPSTGGRGAFQDPTHCSFWNPNSFWYYTQAEQAKYIQGCQAQFVAKRIVEWYPSTWCEEHQILYVDAVLIALKEPHQPGDNGFWAE